MIYLRSLEKRRGGDGYPFDVPAVAALTRLDFTSPVTVFCGGNGCGKTTFMEILVRLTGCSRIRDAARDEYRGQAVEAALGAFRAVRSMVPKRRFFFSAEEFVKYIEWVEAEKRYSRRMIEEADAEYGDNRYAAGLAKMPHANTLNALQNMYASDLIGVSHGEGYMAFFDARLIPGGLYLMDEPEGALTYRNQYLLAVKIREAIKRDCQFIIATHSPVLAAIPEADIYEATDGGFEKRPYEQLENIGFLEMFLRQRGKLFADD